MSTIDRLKLLESLIWYDAGEGPKSGWSPCDDIRFKEALHEAWPKLLAVVDAARYVAGMIPEYGPDKSDMADLRDALVALDEEPK